MLVNVFGKEHLGADSSSARDMHVTTRSHYTKPNPATTDRKLPDVQPRSRERALLELHTAEPHKVEKARQILEAREEAGAHLSFIAC